VGESSITNSYRSGSGSVRSTSSVSRVATEVVFAPKGGKEILMLAEVVRR